jgi:hypothetical protein
MGQVTVDHARQTTIFFSVPSKMAMIRLGRASLAFRGCSQLAAACHIVILYSSIYTMTSEG